MNLEAEIIGLRDELLSGNYEPGPLRRFVIYEPKQRRIAAALFRDRVVHHALCSELEPLIECRMPPRSFACRRGRGLHAAIRSAQRHLRGRLLRRRRIGAT